MFRSRNPRKVLAAVFALAGLALPAGARTMDVTYTGSILTGYDQFGDIGLPGAVLDGLGFRLTFRYDSAIGQRSTQAGVSDQVFGGWGLGAASPLLSTTLTMGGHSLSFGDSYGSGIVNDSYAGSFLAAGFGLAQPLTTRFAAQASERTTDALTGILTSSVIHATCSGPATAFPAPNIETGFTMTACDPGEAGGILMFRAGPSGGLLSNIAAGLSIREMVVSEVAPAPVPLPAAGGMLLLALGVVAVRRRRAA